MVGPLTHKTRPAPLPTRVSRPPPPLGCGRSATACRTYSGHPSLGGRQATPRWAAARPHSAGVGIRHPPASAVAHASTTRSHRRQHMQGWRAAPVVVLRRPGQVVSASGGTIRHPSDHAGKIDILPLVPL